MHPSLLLHPSCLPEPLSPEPALLLGALAGFLASALFNAVPGWPSFTSHLPWARGGSSLRLATLGVRPHPLGWETPAQSGKGSGLLPSATRQSHPTQTQVPSPSPPLSLSLVPELRRGREGSHWRASHTSLLPSLLPCDHGSVDAPPTRWSLSPKRHHRLSSPWQHTTLHRTTVLSYPVASPRSPAVHLSGREGAPTHLLGLRLGTHSCPLPLPEGQSDSVWVSQVCAQAQVSNASKLARLRSLQPWSCQ